MFINELVVNAAGSVLAAAAADLYKSLRTSGASTSRLGALRTNWRRALTNAGIIFVALLLLNLLLGIDVGGTVTDALVGPPFQNERWTRDAWKAFTDRRFTEAIAATDKTIQTFSQAAQRQHQNLAASHEALPPEGTVSPWAHQRIASRGIINDVATSYWIRAHAYDSIGKPEEARIAAEAAASLYYARTWDPRWWPIRGWSPFGFFWSPANP